MIGFSLTEFIKYESKEEYIFVIGERLGTRILSGKPSDVMKRLKCLLDFNNVNTTLLDELMIRRNCIVHDDERFDISLDELEAYYEAIEELLKNLALALKNINILVIDKGGF